MLDIAPLLTKPFYCLLKCSGEPPGLSPEFTYAERLAEVPWPREDFGNALRFQSDCDHPFFVATPSFTTQYVRVGGVPDGPPPGTFEASSTSRFDEHIAVKATVEPRVSSGDSPTLSRFTTR